MFGNKYSSSISPQGNLITWTFLKFPELLSKTAKLLLFPDSDDLRTNKTWYVCDCAIIRTLQILRVKNLQT